VRADEKVVAKDLRRLDGDEARAIQRARDGALLIDLFDRVGQRQDGNGSPRLAGRFEGARDHARPHERAAAVVHGNPVAGVQRREPALDGVLAPRAPGADGDHFGEAFLGDEGPPPLQVRPGDDEHDAIDRFAALEGGDGAPPLQVRPGDDEHDAIDRFAALEGGDGVRQQRPAGDDRKELVGAAHAHPGAGGDDNRRADFRHTPSL